MKALEIDHIWSIYNNGGKAPLWFHQFVCDLERRHSGRIEPGDIIVNMKSRDNEDQLHYYNFHITRDMAVAAHRQALSREVRDRFEDFLKSVFGGTI